jgi:transcriptional regulator with XRE-family HTH domain
MLGDQLRAERERRGIVLEQVSGSTRIRKQYLEAIERQDWEALPEPVFTRGFVHTYAQFLGMDPKSMLNAYGRELRISRAKESSGGPPIEADVTKAVLERLARTKGLDLSRSWSRTCWIMLCLVGACAGAAAVWTVRIPRGIGQGERTATETRVHAELESTVPPTAPDAVGGDDASGADRPGGRGVLQAPAAGVCDDQKHPAESQDRGRMPVVSRLKVSECGVGTDVVDRRLVGRTDRFGEGSVVWFWTRVIDGHRGETIQHVWRREGRVIAVIKLNVGGPQWRTGSRRRLQAGSIGSWTVEARGPEERMLASVGFTCAPAE